ncbi:MAG: GWxTD domain-containing protein [bacterium]
MKYFRQYIIVLIIIFICSIDYNITAQVPGNSLNRENEHPQFYYTIYRIISQIPDTCKLTFLLNVSYDELQFVIEDSVYKAGYEFTLTILDMDKNVIETRIRKKEITVQDFQLTNSRKEFSSLNELFYLAPGDYHLVIELMDVDSRSTRIRKKKISIPDYYNVSFSISDVLFLNKTVQEEGAVYTPNLFANYNKDQKEIYLKFDIYNNIEIDSVDISLFIKDFSNNTYNTYHYKEMLKGFRTTILLRAVRKELHSGNYKLHLKIKGKEETIETMLQFSVDWMQMTSFNIDINSAIEQLKYIAPAKKIKEMINSKEKEKLFNQFWDSRDPTPSTEVNELKKEYYTRVAFANKNFSDSREGWLTDRGEVYIVLGPPDDIKRYPNMVNGRPYEVWYYYRFGNNLIFVDETGLGNFRLTHESWETYHMLRNQH